MLDADLQLTLQERVDVLSARPSVEPLLGYKPAELVSSAVSLPELIHPRDRAAVHRLFSVADGAAGALIVRMRHADGRMRLLGWRYERAETNQGAILEVWLSDPAAPQSGIHQTAPDLMAVMESLGECVCLKDRNHVIAQVNDGYRRLVEEFSGRQSDLTGANDYELFDEEFADCAYELEEQVLSGTASVRMAKETVDRQGKSQWLDCRKAPVRDRDGQVTGIFTIMTVVTEKALTEQALRDSEESLREAQRIAGVGSFVLNLQQRTWTGSDELYEILGLDKSCDRTVDMWRELIVAEDLAIFGRFFGDVVIDRGKRVDAETRFIRQSDAKTRWARIRGELERDAAGRPLIVRGTIEDVTERKEAEAKVRESSDLLQLFVQDAPTGVAMFDREMCYMTASRRWIEDRGLTEWDLVGRSAYEFGREIPERWREQHRRALAGETTPYHEDCYRREDGAERWVRRMVRPWLTGHGSVGGVVVLSEDITARKAAEQALRQSEESLKEAQSIAWIGSYSLDLATGLWTSTEALDSLFGIHSGGEHTVAEWVDLIHPDDRVMMTSYLENEVLAKAHEFSREYRIVRPADGAVRWVHGLGRIDFDAQGNAVRMHGTIQDITARKDIEGSLRESRERLELFVEHAPVSIAMLDRELRYVAASRRWIETYAQNGEMILGRSHYEVVPDIPERWKELNRRGLAGEHLRAEEDLFQRADGTERWVRWELVPWRSAEDEIAGILLFSEDITALKHNEERLQLAANVFRHASEGILITDADGLILDANDAFTRITGYAREEVLGRNPRILSSGRQNREFYAGMWAELKEKGHWSGEIWNRAKGGQIFAEMLTISAVPDAAGRTKQYVAMFSDLTPIKERERRLEHVAHFDVLTGLPNRILLADRLRQAMAQVHRIGRIAAVVYLDLDNFRAVNERHGNQVGDQFLKAITQRMKGVLREGDTLARLGGDEFAAVLLETGDIEESLGIIAQLRDAIAEPVELGGLTLKISASIGVTFYPQAEDVEPDQLVRQADQAMYFAKLAGKARYHVFDPMLDRSMRGRHEDLQRIRQAIHAHEFELYFQPRVNMTTGRILGAEALIRWRHPERGLLLPNQFLPVVEGNLLVIELGEWVIESALSHMARWRQQGLDIPVSVNLDALQLQEPRFVQQLKEMLAAHPEIEPSRLELEVLESSAFQDIAQVTEVIRACSKLGVSFALDDFGTGYSSLSYLKRLPVDVLKIDQSFVHDMLDDPEDLTILEGVLVLANAFRRQAVAEGVETIEHGLMLLRLGCQVGQGFEIARPMPGTDLPLWAAEWHPDPQWVNVSAIDPVDWPILFAGVEHRAWVGEVDHFLRGQRLAPPLMSPQQCRFGAWLNGEKLRGHLELEDLRTIDEVHRKLHEHANRVLNSKDENAGPEGSPDVRELYMLRDALLDRLQAFIRSL